MVPVFGGESISTPFARGRTRGYNQQFQDLLAIHKLSTVKLKLSPCRPGFSTGSPQLRSDRRGCGPPGPQQAIGRAERGRGRPEIGPTCRHGLGQPGRRSAAQVEISRTAHTDSARPTVGRLVRQDIDRTAQAPARPGCKVIGRAGLEKGQGMRVGARRAASGRTGEAAPRPGPRGEGSPEGELRPEKGRGPSTHEMEGPIRPRSAGHRYLMLRVRATRSTTKPDTRSKSQLPSSSCVPGVAPRMVSVFGSERFLRLSDAAAQGVSATNFKILWPPTNCPQFS